LNKDLSIGKTRGGALKEKWAGLNGSYLCGPFLPLGRALYLLYSCPPCRKKIFRKSKLPTLHCFSMSTQLLGWYFAVRSYFGMIFVHPEDGQKGPERALTKGKILYPALCQQTSF
jgi:hypothetical protein